MLQNHFEIHNLRTNVSRHQTRSSMSKIETPPSLCCLIRLTSRALSFTMFIDAYDRENESEGGKKSMRENKKKTR